MDAEMLRRDFLKAAPIAAGALAYAGEARAAEAPASRNLIEPFDYQGVKLGSSRWQQQVKEAREFYLGLPPDDVLHGFRAAAGLPAPGESLGGWAKASTGGIFGQWLSGMARLSRATGDSALRDRASYLMTEWGKTVKPDGDARLRHYAFDKTVCGLIDMQLYLGHPDAVPLLTKISVWASPNLDHSNVPATKAQFSGRPGEWYTLAENLYRAYQLTGDPKFKSFAETWLYHSYWNKFDKTASPPDAHGFHAYSHVNSFSSAAMHYAVSGDPGYLRIIRNAHDYMQSSQCFATGGYGPNEHLVSPEGGLGRALDVRSDCFETMCGSWAGFKLSRYLMQFTGEARFGDWAERLFYNGAGAALPITGRGRNFYYSDYRLSGGMKVYRYDTFTCCSGTYIQDMADYYNLIYYKDPSSLYVNLYTPSEVNWNHQGNEIKVIQETDYPAVGSSTLTLQMPRPAEFSLQFRVPQWTRDMTIKVNGAAVDVAAKPGSWAKLSRRWNSGDKVELQIPLRFRLEPVDRQHPNRVAIVRGPVVMGFDFNYYSAGLRPPGNDADLNRWLAPYTGPPAPFTPPNGPAVFGVKNAEGATLAPKFRPFYEYAENFPYLMYMDTTADLADLW